MRNLSMLPALAALMLAACGAPPAAQEDAAERAALQQRIETLGQRLARARDAADIRRLQHNYGHYMSRGLWADAADLFADDGTIEIGLDGVYRGQARVREYLLEYGGGQEGLPHGVLNEQIQVMPVIHIAPDGETAQARWRGVMLTGELGVQGLVGEGPYQVSYIKQNDVWRIASLHWFNSVTVPYETGWANSEDPTGARFVTTLTPDAPPSVDYEPWPGVYLPPFHFRNDAGVTTANLTGFFAPPQAMSVASDVGDFDALTFQGAALDEALSLSEAEKAAETLQRKFGYYIDKNMWSDAASLFTDDASFEWGGSGVYRGRDNILAYFNALGGEGPQQGVLNDNMILMPTVYVAPDGLSAAGRFQGFSQLARHGEWARWETGIYETHFVNEGGIWKIGSMRYVQTMASPYEDGWGVTALPLNAPLTDPAPDSPPSLDYEPWPSYFVAPFHAPHPVRAGAPTQTALLPSRASDMAALEAQVDDLERRAQALLDIEALENLNAIYGYYLAHNQWDSLASIFAEDGTIEIAMRGVYVGRDAVRRNLNLYGEQGGEQHGLLHNHMQFQPVITLGEDGQTARIRSRAFSIMGNYGAYQQWMAGVYENTFSKIGGEWMFQTDQVFNTYFAPYDLGWRDLPMREPPGITDSNPPDLPPSHPFVLYPAPFLPPYHYPNPVTGQPSHAPGGG